MKNDRNKLPKLINLLIILVVFFLGCRSEDDATAPGVAPEVLAEFDVIKLVITREGMYRVSLSDLGWGEDSIDSIALTHKEQPIPYWINTLGSGSNIIFFGQSSISPYTPDNVYMIQKNPDLAQEMTLKVIPKPALPQVDHIISTVHIEENLIYTPRVISGSPWHWLKIIAPQSQSLEINLPHATPGLGNLRVSLFGVTTAPTSPAHHVRVNINGKYISDAAWDGQTWHILEATIKEGVLVDGMNTIEIHATGEINARIDIVNLDWIEIDYPKSSYAMESQEAFRVSEQSVQFPGSEEPMNIFDISDPMSVSRIKIPSNQQDFLTFQGNPDLRYIAVSPDGYLNPDQILPAKLIPDLRAESGANYLAIGHEDLLEPLEKLQKTRSEQDLSTLAIPTEPIYDQFNGGLMEPQAIQKFLQFALESWPTPPKYVLLVGDASYDFYGYQTPTENSFVPTFMINTTFGGETGSDVLIAQINDDQWPDLAIGRVPARTVEQVETFVSKTLEFEKNSSSANWNNKILAIADGQEPRFKSDASKFLEQFPREYQSQLISPEPGIGGTNQQITEEIEAGQLLTAYFGHGSINMWGKDSLFNTQDSDELNNPDRLSLILNFTCLTGLFTHPTELSLAESLLFNPQGGAVAVLAPTSPTLPTDQTFLSDAFIEAMLQDPTLRLGDITLYSWRKVPTNSASAIDVMQTFLLFGDPALLLPNR